MIAEDMRGWITVGVASILFSPFFQKQAMYSSIVSRLVDFFALAFVV